MGIPHPHPHPRAAAAPSLPPHIFSLAHLQCQCLYATYYTYKLTLWCILPAAVLREALAKRNRNPRTLLLSG